MPLYRRGVPVSGGLPEIASGDALKVVRVKTDETGLELATPATGLPAISEGDAGKVLAVKVDESGYELATPEAGSGGSAEFGPFEYYADMLENPNSADWAANSLAPVDVDDDHVGLLVRAFDDTTAEGVGFSVKVPSTATKMRLSFVSRGKTAPGAAAKVGLNLYSRGIPDNAAVEAWSAAFALTDIDIPTNEYYQYDTQLLTIGAGGGEINLTAGREYQFQLNRNPSVASDLTGDWFLRVLRILFE